MNVLLLSLASNVSQWPLAVLQRKILCSPKSIFPIDLHCKRDVCKTVDRTPPDINMVSYYSLYCIFVSHGGLIFVKLFKCPEKSFFLSDITAVASHVLIAGLSQRHDGSNTFLVVCARRAILLDWVGAIIIYPWRDLNPQTGPKWRHQCKMAAPVSEIFWLHFCTVGGSGDALGPSLHTVYGGRFHQK